MKKYQCHKIVEAGKVQAVFLAGDNETTIWAVQDPHMTNGLVMIRASEELKQRGGPYPPGGYYVRYSDGFESWSPAEAFETGYTEIEGG